MELDKYSKNSSKGLVFKDGLEYHKELNDLKNNYPLASDKIEKKLSDYQLTLDQEDNIPLSNVKNYILMFLIKKRM